MGHRINHKNIGDIQKHAYLKGTILKAYSADEDEYVAPEESRIDTADIKIIISREGEDDTEIFGNYIPLFYHCSHDVEKRANGALEGAAVAFAEDDKVIVQCEITSAGHYKPLRIMGFMDKPKACSWIEDWEGETIISNHPWQNLFPTGVPCSGPDVIQYNFGDEKIVKIESIVAASGGCVCAPEVDLRYSPEQPLNLKNFSGFECKAYLAEFEPRTFTKTFCSSHCWKDVDWIVWGDITLDLGWRLVGSSALYDFWASYGFLFYQGCKWNSDTEKCDYFGLGSWDTFEELIARVGTWSNLTEFTTGYIAGPPWGNGDYELSWISPYIRLYLPWDAYALHGTTNMKVYFSDITIHGTTNKKVYFSDITIK